MAWVKIGEAYTDNNGIATLPYTGTGRGVVRGMAKSTVDERMIQSETYDVFDCINYDGGTSSDPSVSFWILARGTLNRQSEYTQIDLTSEQSNVMAYFYLTNTDSFVIEFDCIFDCSDGGSNEIHFRNSSWTQLRGIAVHSLPKDTWTHIKLQVKDGKLDRWINGTQQTQQSITGASMFVFQLDSGDNYFRFKNFKYYPI